MADYDKKVVTPLLRRRAHLVEVGADPAKLAELDHALRMAGYPADDDSTLDGERVEQSKPGVPRAEDENPPSDPPHDDETTPRDDQAKTDEKADVAKVEAERTATKDDSPKPEGGKVDENETAKAKAGDTEGSAKPSSVSAEDKARRVSPMARSSKPVDQSSKA